MRPEVNYVVETKDDYIGIVAHQISMDDGNLLVLKFKEVEGASIPQLTCIAMFPKGFWHGVREVDDVTLRELTRWTTSPSES